jgi:hypothetical protein
MDQDKALNFVRMTVTKFKWTYYYRANSPDRTQPKEAYYGMSDGCQKSLDILWSSITIRQVMARLDAAIDTATRVSLAKVDDTCDISTDCRAYANGFITVLISIKNGIQKGLRGEHDDN